MNKLRLTAFILLSPIVQQVYCQDTAAFEYAPFYDFTQKVHREGGGDPYWDVTYYTMEIYSYIDPYLVYSLEYFTYDNLGKISSGSLDGTFRYNNNKFYINKYLLRSTDARDYIENDWFLAYNTSLNTGDTLFHFNYNMEECEDTTCQGLYSVVDSVKYVLINNIYHKVQYFSWKDISPDNELMNIFNVRKDHYAVVEGFGVLGETINYMSAGFSWSEEVERYCHHQWGLDEVVQVSLVGEINFDCDFLSIDDLESTQFKVTNPNYNSVRVFGSTQFEYRILNLSGQETQTGLSSGEIDISRMSSGVYVLEIKVDNTISRLKLIKSSGNL